ncbi:Txe/YoeB family addiction module toxin [Bacteroidia bacterium]|nr:Txe/YoeB family addiction module toxin [Bacteroidia bacterium]
MGYDIRIMPLAQRHIDLLEKSEPGSYKKVMRLLLDIEKHPRIGIGKPKPLSSNRAGLWSRRITDKHRLVYEIDDDKIVVLVLTAAGHYDD